MRNTSCVWVSVVALALMVRSPQAALAETEVDRESPTVAAESPAPTIDDSLVPAPPDAEDVEWAVVSVLEGPEIEATSGEGIRAQYEALLAASGATYEDIGQLNAQALDPESGEALGLYAAIRVAGADEDVLRGAMLGVLREGLAFEGYTLEESEIGGKAVTIVTHDADERVIIYVHMDVAYLVDLPDQQLAAVLAALP